MTLMQIKGQLWDDETEYLWSFLDSKMSQSTSELFKQQMKLHLKVVGRLLDSCE